MSWLTESIQKEKQTKGSWLTASLKEKDEEDTEYNAFRSAATGFLESAVGVGDELDATVRVLSGEAAGWSEAINQSRAELRAFEEENPTASTITNLAGFGAGLFIPGMGIAKIAQAGTKLDRAIKVGGLGAAEGAVYGFLTGEGEERLTSAGVGAAGGAVLGGLAGAYLTKNTDEIQKATRKLDAQTYKGKGSFMGGEQGFVRVGKAAEPTFTRKGRDTSLNEREAVDVIEEGIAFGPPKGQSGLTDSLYLSTREWIAKNVGERAARLAEDAETMIRHDQREIDELFDTVFLDAAKKFDENKMLKNMAVRMNETMQEGRRVSWEDFNKVARTPEEKLMVQKLKEQTKLLQNMDFVKFGDMDYFPAKTLPGVRGAKLRTEDYDNPIVALKDFAEDISSAKALAARFKIDTSKIKNPETGESRLSLVINAIEKEAKEQGASSDVAANLANGLRSQLIAAKQGGNTVGAVIRRVTSATLLGNPLNAVLNMAEGVTAPIYQNGVTAWAKTLPKAVLATFNQQFGIKNKNWMSNRQLGLDKDFMGELANTGKKAMNDAVDSSMATKLSENSVRNIDKLNQTLYKYSGVQTVNRMGQEILSNSAVQRGIDLATKGTEKSLAKLREHDGMRGLTESEFRTTVKALKDKNLSNPWVVNFAGASMNKWQPVSASTLPKAFHDNPNGRMAYSMLSYMNKQLNSFRLDVGLNIQKAKDKGLNTKEGAEAAKKAMINTAKYAGLFGVVAGMWDDFRKTLDLSNDKYLEDLMTPEGISSAMVNQMSSNLTSGVVNIRAEEYGGKPIEFKPAPVSFTENLLGGAAESIIRGIKEEEEAGDPAFRAAQTYLPGVANVDRVLRMTTGERLFEKLGLLED